jgi:thiosulfate/3-mercaptopyruvate sulfurtransferase
MTYTTLIDAEQLKTLLATENDVVVVDCRHRLDQPHLGRELYRQAHIPGALFAHLDSDLSAPITLTPSGHSGRHPLPAPDVWLQRLGAWGIAPTTQVIAYDDQGGMAASRLWWMLRVVGHNAAAVLDGGIQEWQAVEGAMESGDTQPKRTLPPYPGQFRNEWVATMDEIKSQVANPQAPMYLIVDARAANRFRGEGETIDPVAGHIPTALNVPYQGNLTPAGTLLPADLLRARFEPIVKRAQSEGREVVMSCGSGVSACHNLLAMAVAGLPPARLFPNSWSGWCNTPGLPVATGDV